MKMQRNIGVNGYMSELQESAVNQGGTAERFGPFGNRNERRFFILKENPPEQKSVFPDKKMRGKGSAENERKRRTRHGKGKISKKYHIA